MDLNRVRHSIDEEMSQECCKGMLEFSWEMMTMSNVNVPKLC